ESDDYIKVPHTVNLKRRIVVVVSCRSATIHVLTDEVRERVYLYEPSTRMRDIQGAKVPGTCIIQTEPQPVLVPRSRQHSVVIGRNRCTGIDAGTTIRLGLLSFGRHLYWL